MGGTTCDMTTPIEVRRNQGDDVYSTEPSPPAYSIFSIFDRVRSHDMFRHGLLVFVAFTLANVGSFLFHVIVSRNLGVVGYGSLYAVLSLVQLASLPAGVFTTVISKFAAEFQALNDTRRLRALTIWVCKAFAPLSLLYIGVGTLLSPAIARFMAVPGWAIILAAAISSGAILFSALRAVSQGTHDFRGFSASVTADAGAKAGFAAIVSAFAFGFAGALIAFFSGALLGGLVIIVRLWRQYADVPRTRLQLDWRRALITTAGALALTASITILSYGDVLVVKHFFSAREAGVYAAASLGGKILFFLVNFAPMVLIPKAVARQALGRSAIGVLVGALFMVISLSGTGLSIFSIGSKFVLHALVGGGFEDAQSLLPWYGVAMSILAVTNVVASYSIAIHRFAFAIPLTCVALATVGTVFFYHPSLQVIVFVLVIGNTLALTTVSIAVAIRKK